MSFAEAIGCRWRSVPIAAWRRHWIGKMPRGTKSPDLKRMAMLRCRELGFEVIKHDEAEPAAARLPAERRAAFSRRRKRRPSPQSNI
jgi:hypothetical protein